MTNAAPSTWIHPRLDLAALPITGKDRLSWLNGLVTQDVAKLTDGTGAYALAVGKTGRILTELWVIASKERALVLVDRGRAPALVEHFERHLIMEDAEIGEPLTSPITFVHGLRAPDALARARAAGADAALIDYTGHGCAVVVGDVCELGDVTTPAAALALDAAVLDDAAWEERRIAWGLPRAGVDYGEVMPQEASLERRAVSFAKGCYLGQEAVFMLEKRGQTRRRLVRLSIEPGSAPVGPGVGIVLPEGDEVGTLTSVASSVDGGLVAVASLKTKHSAVGTALRVAGHAATVLGPAGA